MARKGGKNGGGKPGAGRDGARPIIIRREEVIEGGHHGGAWKVAYADFVTAMMAFFLLMWLINATTEAQRRGIAAYFSPMADVENGFSASGMIPGGAAPVAENGAQLVDQGPAQLATLKTHGDDSKTDNDADLKYGKSDTPAAPTTPTSLVAIVSAAAPTTSKPQIALLATPPTQAGSHDGSGGRASEKQAAAEEKALQDAARRLRAAVAHDPALAAVAGQMAIDVTPEGLRIQIMDAAHQPMFNRGSAVPNPRARALLQIAAGFIERLPEPVAIGGYTDAAPYRAGEPSNWSLSSERADAARDVLAESGLPDARLSHVTGYADRKLLLPADPLDPANRRIVLTLQRQWPAPGRPPGKSASP
ncbi:flagellar motor protein MotB [Lichenicoccus sp.]|uniref:flagellar motor protein MotB n=1 Tax=Lichenicoccus sp. TaxID=2781899 RepID=UPI003D0DA068